MIYKVNDNEHFNLTMDIDIREKEFNASIGVCITLWNKQNGKYLKDWFPAAEFSEALNAYRRYENLLFSKRSETA